MYREQIGEYAYWCTGLKDYQIFTFQKITLSLQWIASVDINIAGKATHQKMVTDHLSFFHKRIICQ